MPSKFMCHACYKLAEGLPRKVPMLVRAETATIVDVAACGPCQQKHQGYMENNFWHGAAGLAHGKCAKCQVGLTSQNSRTAYRRANNDGAWDMTLLCDGCHAEYAKCCGGKAAKQ